MKVVINKCHGGFNLSDEGIELYGKLSGINLYVDGVEDYFTVYNLNRSDPNLVQVVLTLGDKANGTHSKLKVVEIPSDVKWTIEEYDGMEWVSEEHRTWH